MRLGFAGLGLMGRPMATTLLRSGQSLIVYNRSPEPAEALRALGASVAVTSNDLFAVCDAIILMLADDTAIDALLNRQGLDFAERVSGKLIINMGTHSPTYSHALEAHVVAVGGRFVEAPVSGSQGPASAGQLVAMLAGAPAAIREARSLIAPMCRRIVEIGPVPSAMTMKLAVNLYLLTSVTAMAEATRFSARSRLDLAKFTEVIASGPLSSRVSDTKLDKMARRDFAPQATIRDVVKNARLVADAAGSPAAPLLRESLSRFEQVLERGCGNLDMAAVLLSYDEEGECL